MNNQCGEYEWLLLSASQQPAGSSGEHFGVERRVIRFTGEGGALARFRTLVPLKSSALMLNAEKANPNKIMEHIKLNTEFCKHTIAKKVSAIWEKNA